jgi:hypothetical protein
MKIYGVVGVYIHVFNCPACSQLLYQLRYPNYFPLKWWLTQNFQAEIGIQNIENVIESSIFH